MKAIIPILAIITITFCTTHHGAGFTTNPLPWVLYLQAYSQNPDTGRKLLVQFLRRGIVTIPEPNTPVKLIETHHPIAEIETRAGETRFTLSPMIDCPEKTQTRRKP